MTNGMLSAAAAAADSCASSAHTGTRDTKAADSNDAAADANGGKDQDNKSAQNKSERARQRWAILRSALLGRIDDDGNGNGNGTNANATAHASTSTVVNRASIHRFEGFRLLDRKLVPSEETEKCAHIAKQVLLGGENENCGKDEDGRNDAQEDDHREYEYAEYTIPLPTQQLPAAELHSPTSNNLIKIRTRERRRRMRTQNQSADETASGNDGRDKKTRIDQVMRGLLSHRLHGVDNTGQACVWDSESTLTYCLLASTGLDSCKNDATDDADGKSIPSPFPLGVDNISSLAVAAVPAPSDDSAIPKKKKLRVIELGAGMAGLCGLSLAAFGIQNEFDVEIDLALTDGHPDAVQSNRVCAALTTQLHADTIADANTPNRSRISCQRLLWNDGDDGFEDCRALTNNGQDRYQLCLSSDCVHFQEFHAALIATIGRLLDVGGVCLLCQPRRADSLENFIKVVDAVNSAAETSAVFEMNLFERYNQRLWDLHQMELAKGDDEIYDPDIHYPLLLVLKKVGEYKENVHTAAAVQRVRERQVK